MNNEENQLNKSKSKVELKMVMNNLDLFELEEESINTLKEIIKLFEPEKHYKEKEVNEILKEVFDDYITLRRFLIEYNLLERKSDGSQYWRR